METSKRRQIPTSNACPNFSFRGLRKKILLHFFMTTFHFTLINYSVVSSGNPVRAHTGDFTMAAAGIRPHQIQEMIDDPIAWAFVCLSFRMSITWVGCTKIWTDQGQGPASGWILLWTRETRGSHPPTARGGGSMQPLPNCFCHLL